MHTYGGGFRKKNGEDKRLINNVFIKKMLFTKYIR